MTDEQAIRDDEVLPESIAQATMTLLGVEVTMHVLSNGQRVIEGDGMHRLLNALFSGNHAHEDIEKVAAAIIERGEHRRGE